MKHIITILLAACIVFPVKNFAQNAGKKYPELQPKSSNSAFYLTASRHDTAASAASWSAADSSLFFYTITPLLKQEYDKVHDVDSGWINNLFRSIHYNATNNDTGEVLQNYNDDTKSFTNDSRFEYIYDLNNNIVTTISFSWDDSSVQWVNANKDDYAYDENNNLTQHTISYWDKGTSSWIFLQQFQYTYDAMNNQAKEIDLSWTGTVWQNVNQIFNSFNSGNLKTSQRIQNWAGSKWANSTLDTFLYNSNNKLSSDIVLLYDAPSKQFDVNFRKSDYEYDAGLNLTRELISVYSDTSFVPFYEELFSYDVNANNTIAQLKIYNSTTTDFYDQDQKIFYWAATAPTKITAVNPDAYHLNIFPDPASDWLTVAFSSPQSRTALFKIADATGKISMQWNQKIELGNNIIKANISKLSPGAYFIQISDNLSSLSSGQQIIIAR